MKALRYAPEAETDLRDIARYIARDSVSHARNFVGELRDRCDRLPESPKKGRDRSDLKPGLRSIPHGRYLIFYLVAGNAVRIERVLHGSRDLGALFES